MKRLLIATLLLFSSAHAAPEDDAMKSLLKKAGFEPYLCRTKGMGAAGDYCADLKTDEKTMRARIDKAAKALGFKSLEGWKRDPEEDVVDARTNTLVKGKFQFYVTSMDLRFIGYADAYVIIGKK